MNDTQAITALLGTIAGIVEGLKVAFTSMGIMPKSDVNQSRVNYLIALVVSIVVVYATVDVAKVVQGSFLETIDANVLKLGLGFAASFGSKFIYKLLAGISAFTNRQVETVLVTTEISSTESNDTHS